MYLENEIITLSNKVRFNYKYPLIDIISQANLIVDIMKCNTKEVSLLILDNLVAKYENKLTGQELITLKEGVFFLKVFLLAYYDQNDLFSFIDDCFKEWLKEFLNHSNVNSFTTYKISYPNPSANAVYSHLLNNQ